MRNIIQCPCERDKMNIIQSEPMPLWGKEMNIVSSTEMNQTWHFREDKHIDL